MPSAIGPQPMPKQTALTVHGGRDGDRAGRPRVDVAQGERQRLQTVGCEVVLVVENIVVRRARRAQQRIYPKPKEIVSA